MKINEQDRPVLNTPETEAYAHAMFLRQRGVDKAEAAHRALGLMEGKPTKRFAAWLSDDKVTIVKGEVVWVDGEAPEASTTGDPNPEPDATPDEEADDDESDDDSESAKELAPATS